MFRIVNPLIENAKGHLHCAVFCVLAFLSLFFLKKRLDLDLGYYLFVKNRHKFMQKPVISN